MALERIMSSLKEKAVDCVVDSIRGAWDLDRGFKKLRRHLLNLESMREDAEERQRESVAVTEWLHGLKEVVYEAEDLLDDVAYESLREKAGDGMVRDFFSTNNQVAFRLKIGMKLNDIIKKIEEVKSLGTQYGFKVLLQREREKMKHGYGRKRKRDGWSSFTEKEKTETWSFVKASDVVGREMEKEQIVDILVDNLGNNMNVSVFAIVGMGGLGKTTLAQLIYNDPRVVNHFQFRAWICVSDVWSMEKIIVDIIASVPEKTGKKGKLETLELQQCRLRKALTGKRYLIVLDDIWNEEPGKWKPLKDIMDCGDKGSVILVTTRSTRVSEIMTVVPSYDLSYLSEDDSWTLFSNRAFAPGAERPQELVEIGKVIANKCGQLPLALEMIGSLLYMESDKSQWLMIKEASSLWNLQTGIFPALWLSYKHLPPHSKRCFTFCTIFPKDYTMDKDTLIKMWMAHGFIPSSVGIRLEDKGCAIFNQLVQRTFLHSIEEKGSQYYGIVTTCRMHDLVHDLGKFIAGNEYMALPIKELELKESSEVAAPKDIYHLSISNVKDKTWKVYSKILRSLLYLQEYNRRTEIPPHTSLRVLQLRCDTKHLSSLKHLQHLRYLDLSNSRDIKELPESICALFHLQTLDLAGCGGLLKLPRRIGCMISLRHLYLGGCDDLKEMPRGMGRLTNLQTLTKYTVGDEAQGKGGIGELKPLPLCSYSFELYNMRHVKDVKQAMEANLHSKDIHHLKLYYSSRFLDVEGKDMNEGDRPDPVLETGDGSDQVFEALKPPGSIKVLGIYNYSGLKLFNPRWMVDLQHLVQLKLYDCRECHRLPPLWRLKSLEKLSLVFMKSLKYIIFDYGEALSSFPSLKKLKLDELQSLEGWWENRNLATDMTINCFSALESLIIWHCPELSDPMPWLPHLNYLYLFRNRKMPLGSINPLTWSSLVTVRIDYVENVENLNQTSDNEDSGEMNDNEDSGERSDINEDLNETRKNNNEELNEMSGNVGDFFEMSDYEQPHSRLKAMELVSCDWIFCSPVRLGLWRSMTSLQTLHIYDCEYLVDLPEVLQGMESLRRLSIERCQNMTGTSSTITNPCLPPHLEEVYFSSCRGLTTMLSCPASLKSVHIEDCPNIITLAAGNKELKHLTCLESITIRNCNSLESLASKMEGLTDLRVLRIEGCGNPTSLPEGLNSLLTLRIEHCEEPTSIPQGLTALQRLVIHRCKNLTSLPEGLLQRLPTLKWLEIVRCPELEKKCAEGSGEYWHLISNNPPRRIVANVDFFNDN